MDNTYNKVDSNESHKYLLYIIGILTTTFWLEIEMTLFLTIARIPANLIYSIQEITNVLTNSMH